MAPESDFASPHEKGEREVLSPTSDAERFSSIVMGMTDCVIGLDSQWRIAFLNAAAAAALESDEQSLVGQVIWDLVPEVLGTPLETTVREAMAEGVPKKLEHPCPEASPEAQQDDREMEAGQAPLSTSGRRWIEIRAQPTEQELIVFVSDVTQRKQAELASRVSEQWFNQVVDGMAVAIYLTDAEGHILRYNRAAVEMWGQAPALHDDSARFCGSMRMYLPDGTPLPHDQCPMAEVLRTGEAMFGREILVERPDGACMTVLANPSPVRDDQGELLGAINCMIDISDRRAAEAAAERYANQQAAVAQLARVALSGRKLQEVMDYAVKHVARTLGTEMCKVLELEPDGQRLRLRAGVGWKPGYVGHTTVDVVDSQAGYTLATGKPVIVDDLRKEKRFKSLSLLITHGVVSGLSVPIPSTNGHFWGVLGTHSTRPHEFNRDDVAFFQAVAYILAETIHRDQHERALEASEARAQARAEELAAVMESVPAMVFVACDANAERVIGSHEAYSFLGLPRGTNLTQFVGAAHSVLDRITLYENDRKLSADEMPLFRAVRGEHVYNWEGRVEFRDGGSRTVLGNATPLYDDQDQVRGAVAAMLDVTEQKEVEARLKQWTQTLEQRVAERTAELEQRASQLQVLAAELTEAEQRERQRLAQVLHDDLQQLLVGAKMQAGTLRVLGDATAAEKAVCSLESLLDQAISSSRSLSSELAPTVLYEMGLAKALHWLARWAKEKYELDVHVSADESVSLGNPQMRVLLFQAVRELLLNVVKHAGVNEARLEMGWHEGRLRLIVEDQGGGFDWQAIQQRDDRSGCGLFGFHQRLELLGVDVKIDSAPGRGTRVTFLAQATRETPEVDVPVPSPALPDPEAPDRPVLLEPAFDRPLRVLLTDDHQMLREALANVLSGHPDIELVGQASTGQEAIKLADELQPDVIVMDISLPDMSGIEVTRRLKGMMPTLTVIGLSIHDKQDVASAMYGAGAAAYLSKTGSFAQLLETIRHYAAAHLAPQ